jgi:hypothetical protein
VQFHNMQSSVTSSSSGDSAFCLPTIQSTMIRLRSNTNHYILDNTIERMQNKYWMEQYLVSLTGKNQLTGTRMSWSSEWVYQHFLVTVQNPLVKDLNMEQNDTTLKY